MNNTELATKILEAYKIHHSVKTDEIHTLQVHKAQRYALGKILSFTYAGRKFYIVDDYSLDDNPEYVKNLIQDINHLVGGDIIKNPIPQSDGPQYALGLNDVEYYLWEDRA